MAAAFAISLLTPGTALGLSTRSATTTTAVGDGILVATARCHADEHVISGGFKGPSGNVVLTSRRAGPRSWRVVTEFNSAEKLTAYAYCSKGSALTAHASAVKTLAASGSFITTARANCGRGEVVVSGGYETIKPAATTHEIEAFKSLRAGNSGWRVAVGNNENDAKFRVFAYCRSHGLPKARTNTGSDIPHSTEGSATTHCRRGEQLLAGGYATSPRTDFHSVTGPDLFYDTSYRSGNRAWTASAYNYGNIAGKITAIAYCS